MTLLGEIWIYKALSVWLIAILLFLFPLGAVAMWDGFESEYGRTHDSRVTSYGIGGIICRGFGWTILGLICWAFGSLCSILICEIVFFCPLAFGMISVFIFIHFFLLFAFFFLFVFVFVFGSVLVICA